MIRNVFLPLALGVVGLLAADPVAAQIYVNGSVSKTSSNAFYLTHNSGSGSAGVDVALGRYVRVGIAHSQEVEDTEGWVIREILTQDGELVQYLNDYRSVTHAWANSLDFTFILYEGDIIVPYLKAGLIWKRYSIEEEEAGVLTERSYADKKPGDNLGAGIGFKLNRQFTLKFLYNTSPGHQVVPGDTEARTVRDKKASVGLTYQL